MLEAKFDMAKLERSLKSASRAFGDSTQQAVARWSVQVGRELAVSTQVYGRTGTRKKQEFAIDADARRVIWPVDEIKPSRTGQSVRFRFEGRSGNWVQSRVLKDADAVNNWIEMHRTRRRSRTSKLPFSELAICTKEVFKQAMKIRFQRAGMAKGGWLGAANQAARFQKGVQRITIGKNFLGYAQKHSRFGSARLNRSAGFKPVATLRNKARHSSSPNVLNPSEITKAVGFGLRKTISWYRHAAKKAIDQS